MNGWTPDCTARDRGSLWLGCWSCLITPAQPTGATPQTPQDSHPVKQQEALALFSWGKRAPRQVPDQAKLFLSWQWHFHRVHGFLQQWGLEEAGNHVLTGMGRKRGRRRTRGEREQSVNILTGTHKEPVLSKNLIQD